MSMNVLDRPKYRKRLPHVPDDPTDASAKHLLNCMALCDVPSICDPHDGICPTTSRHQQASWKHVASNDVVCGFRYLTPDEFELFPLHAAITAVDWETFSARFSAAQKVSVKFNVPVLAASQCFHTYRTNRPRRG